MSQAGSEVQPIELRPSWLLWWSLSALQASFPFCPIKLNYVAKTLKVTLPGARLMCPCTQSDRHVWLFATLWMVTCQAPRSMGFSRQKYWSGLLCPTPGDLPDPGVEGTSPVSPALQVDSLPTEPPGQPSLFLLQNFCSCFSTLEEYILQWRNTFVPFPAN